ncbi:GNAT family N-acetyltransferase [bacterium]|jgi:ribosomal protein S18 acetylase RimI-like enzyme|nr:GNAT family N-acetyltransferase [bacterium]
MKIREIKIKDVDLFVDFFRNSINNQFTEYSKKARDFFIKKEWNREKIKTSIKRSYVIFILAFDKEKIIGYLIGSHHFGGIASIMWVAVADNYQGKGIGTKLIDKYISLLKKEGAHKVVLTVTIKDNIGFYEKLGFKVQYFSKKDYFGLDSYMMYKDIQKPKW